MSKSTRRVTLTPKTPTERRQPRSIALPTLPSGELDLSAMSPAQRGKLDRALSKSRPRADVAGAVTPTADTARGTTAEPSAAPATPPRKPLPVANGVTLFVIGAGAMAIGVVGKLLFSRLGMAPDEIDAALALDESEARKLAPHVERVLSEQVIPHLPEPVALLLSKVPEMDSAGAGLGVEVAKVYGEKVAGLLGDRLRTLMSPTPAAPRPGPRAVPFPQPAPRMHDAAAPSEPVAPAASDAVILPSPATTGEASSSSAAVDETLLEAFGGD